MPEAKGARAGRTSRVGIVVIGRNEGDRLLACLESLRGLGCMTVYVDSGSGDGSAARAAPLCDVVIEVDVSRPLSAARSRNEGFATLRSTRPDAEYVQFL